MHRDSKAEINATWYNSLTDGQIKNHDGVPNTGIKGDVHDPVTWYCFHFKQVSMADNGLLKV